MSVPKLRFKADDGCEFQEWEEKRLGEVFRERVERSNGTEELLAVTIANGVTKQSDSSKRNTAADDTSNYKVVHKGDLAYNTMRMWQGAGGASDYDGIISPAYTVLICNEGNDVTFFAYMFKQTYMLHQFEKHSQGLTSDTWNLKYKNFSMIKVFVPLLLEQQKIAACLSALDNIINQTQSEIDAWEKQKRGVMQLLFGQKVRFKADDGSEFPEWISIKLNGILNEYREMSEKGGIYEHASLTKEGVILKTERYDRDFLVKDENKAYRVTHINDICYNPANLKFGVICRNKLGDVIFSPIYVTFKVNLSYDPVFVEYLVTRPDFINYALRYEEGTVYERMAVKQEDLLSISVNVPCTEEQKKIAACLSTFDTIIGRAKQELSAYRELKKGLLQQMFV